LGVEIPCFGHLTEQWLVSISDAKIDLEWNFVENCFLDVVTTYFSFILLSDTGDSDNGEIVQVGVL